MPKYYCINPLLTEELIWVWIEIYSHSQFCLLKDVNDSSLRNEKLNFFTPFQFNIKC